MIHICKFNEPPATINNGGYLKGRWIVWLNLSVYPNVSSVAKDGEDAWAFAAHTDRLVLHDHSISAFLEVVDPTHLSMASTQELEAILKYFDALDDIESWRAIRRVQIQGYDSSDKVNCFYLGDQPMWLDKATRVGLVNSLNIEKEAGRMVSELWAGSNKIELNVDVALQLLFALELYAKDCYGITASHTAYIESLQSIEELRDFNIGADYPEIPRFSIA